MAKRDKPRKMREEKAEALRQAELKTAFLASVGNNAKTEERRAK